MMAATLVRLSAGFSGRRALSATVRSGLGAPLRIPALKQHLPHNVSARRSFVVSSTSHQAAAAAAAATTKRAGTKKATKAKSTKAKAKAPKAKKEPVKKLKPWEKRGPDGKLLPLPSASKPKRRSPFLIFVTQRAKELRNDPSMMAKNKEGQDKFDVRKLAVAVGSEWRSMSDAQKRPYLEQAEGAAIQYEKDMERWRNSLTAEDIRRENAYISAQRKKGKTGTARLRHPTQPKVPLSAFFRFTQVYRSENPDVASQSIVEMAKQAGARWKSMSPSEKGPYEDAAAKEFEKYRRDLAEWKALNQ